MRKKDHHIHAYRYATIGKTVSPPGEVVEIVAPPGG